MGVLRRNRSRQRVRPETSRTIGRTPERGTPIRHPWAKGLKEKVVVVRHALKNALIPVVTLLGLRLPLLIGGTVILEELFQLPGMGSLILYSTKFRDYPVVSGTLFILAVAMVFINLIVDLTYAYLDPRVQYE